MGIFDTTNKNGKSHGPSQQAGAFARQTQTITKNAPAMSADQKAAALSLAKDFGTTNEYNLIKSLRINVPNPISGATDLVNNVLKFINRAIGA